MSGGRIPRAFIDDLLVRIDIVELIDSHVPLKKTGANYVARCPFHSEKTPSFSVNSHKQFFHCFGCGASGNAISFLMEFNHLDFVEAVEDLAAFAGVDVPKEESGAQADKVDLQNLYGLMEQVADFYVQQLRTGVAGRQAVAYLKKRDLSGAAATRFKIGYAPQDWQALTAHFPQQALIEVGLLGANDNGGVYARFRHRVMFPIRDKRGRVIGFGGRVLDDSLPKYLNSPETPLFHKGREVYGLYELLKSNAKPPRILLVEGYMDVIALAQSGIDYAVAALGTATSQAHFELLFRYTAEVVLCFDGDNAGREAIWKAMDAAFSVLQDGRQIRVMLLPQGHDPDSWVRGQGVEGFIGDMLASQVLSDYFFGQLAEEFNLQETEGRAQYVNKAKPYLAKLPDSIFKDMMLARLQKISKVAVDVSDKTARLNSKAVLAPRQKGSRPPLERQTLAMLVQIPSLIGVLEERGVDWDGLEFKGADKFKDILRVLLLKKPATTSVLLEHYRGHPDEAIIKQLAAIQLEAGVEQEFSGAWDKLLEQGIDARFNRLLAKANSGSEQDKEEFRKLSMHRSSK
ncbi:DNA primase [Methylovulum psychrotolerans]|uniref:DNA primase n=1 Tax=Methylovulum psychrotolerans TaxID=1704499 RepID=A0A2S5CSQ7_9GAMM|nr:DNA primase [Methylovulum psychrotolerans]POZ53869.1 DNA primase [Methylovulum psychrotolerans]